jgi:hypothetical protein
MKNKKTRLIIKGVLLLCFVILVLADPVQSTGRKWIRFGILVFFTISFVMDLIDYKKDNA